MALLNHLLKGRRNLSIITGLIAGMLFGLLITASVNQQANSPINSNPQPMPPEIDRLSTSELESLTLKALSKLNEKRGSLATHAAGAREDYGGQPIDSWRQINPGMQNVRRLLPLARRLTLEALREADVGDPLKRSGLLREQRLINGVHKIVFDSWLGDRAEVWDERLWEIRIGPGYALSLTSDDDAIFLLGHELMHVAARSGRLNQFIENVAENARLSASVEPTENQREELACEFTGAEVLKRFIALYPTEEPEAVRFARAVGYESHSVRLARAWEDFCASYNGDARDGEHLSETQTIRALFGLDPEMKALLPQDSNSSPLCH
jgi:hypothetical protein